MEGSIRFRCPACSRRLKARPGKAGGTASCPCGRLLRVPGLPEDPAEGRPGREDGCPSPTSLLALAGLFGLLVLIVGAFTTLALFAMADRQTRLVMVVSGGFGVGLVSLAAVVSVAPGAAGGPRRARSSRAVRRLGYVAVGVLAKVAVLGAGSLIGSLLADEDTAKRGGHGEPTVAVGKGPEEEKPGENKKGDSCRVESRGAVTVADGGTARRAAKSERTDSDGPAAVPIPAPPSGVTLRPAGVPPRSTRMPPALDGAEDAKAFSGEDRPAGKGGRERPVPSRADVEGKPSLPPGTVPNSIPKVETPGQHGTTPTVKGPTKALPRPETIGMLDARCKASTLKGKRARITGIVASWEQVGDEWLLTFKAGDQRLCVMEVGLAERKKLPRELPPSRWRITVDATVTGKTFDEVGLAEVVVISTDIE